ncbi:MAG: nuclear transport factor 2 family protein [Acidimicrobiales bacterium]
MGRPRPGGCLAMLTDDCVFDATGPAPDGVLSTGKDEIRAAWQPIFDDPTSVFEAEEVVGLGDRVVARWRYTWAEGHIRGIDLFAVRDGKVSEKRVREGLIARFGGGGGG